MFPDSSVCFEALDDRLARISVKRDVAPLQPVEIRRDVHSIGSTEHGYVIEFPMVPDQDPWVARVRDDVVDMGRDVHEMSVASSAATLLAWTGWQERTPLDWMLAALPAGTYFAVLSPMSLQWPDEMLLSNVIDKRPPTMAQLHHDEELFAAAIAPDASQAGFDPKVLVGVVLLDYVGSGHWMDAVWLLSYRPGGERLQRRPDESRLLIVPITGSLILDCMGKSPSMQESKLKRRERWATRQAERSARILAGRSTAA